MRFAKTMLLSLLLAPGCDGPSDRQLTPPDRGGGSGAPPLSTDEAPFPWPQLSDFEPEVRDHLAQTRAVLSTALKTPGGAIAGLASSYGEAGIVYHGYALRNAALAAYAEAEALDSKDPRWPYLVGHVLRTGEDMEYAVEAFRRALALDPTVLAPWVALGDALFELDRKDEARDAYERALALSPECAAAHSGLGRVFLEEKQYEAAATRLEEALRLAPQASAYRYPLGLAYRGLGNREQALEQMQQRGMLRAPPADPLLTAVREVPTGWRVHLRRGTSLFTEGRFSEALSEFERAAQVAPEVATVRLNLGSALVRVGRREESLPHFEAAAQLDPSAALPWFNLGVLAGARGEDQKAIDFYRRATVADSGLIDADFNRANAHRRLGEFDEAIHAYRSVIDEEPGRMAARLGEALSLVRLGKRADAAAHLAEAVELVPLDRIEESRGARNAWARLLSTPTSGIEGESLPNPVRALELANALVAEESSLEHVETCAMAYAALGRFDVAIDLQQKAITAARGAQLDSLSRTLESNLARYQSGRAAVDPWALDSVTLTPPPLHSDPRRD